MIFILILCLIGFFISIFLMLIGYFIYGFILLGLILLLKLLYDVIESDELKYIGKYLYDVIESDELKYIGKYLLIVFTIIIVIRVVLVLKKKFQSKTLNKNINITTQEKNHKILIIDNSMEDLFTLKKENFI